MSTLALVLSLALQASPPAKPLPKPAAQTQKKAPAEDVAAATQAWHAERLQHLQSPDGWLTLVGLTWLKEGEQTAGSAPGSAVPLPSPAPANAGTFVRKGDTVSFQPAPGVAFTLEGKPFTGGALKTDEKGAPDVVRLGSVNFQIIRRQDRLGVRVKDAEAAARKQFHGIPMYPASADWKVEAKLVPDEKPRMLSVPTVLGYAEEMKAAGTLVFTMAGKEYRLTPVGEEGDEALFIVFGDETNRDATYGAGRFLEAPLPDKDGRVVLDFNRAYNPPCAFSRFATCPLPPRGNRLALRVEAGEKRAGDH
ncbi:MULTISPECIES: DUF1684 domain-containing protein [unclassified Corallococcus]|uniref:DUF1684 domain-containing protein n=1 Tax=unclassified Corallococcus TaxID=2685029 RepID=UPI001A8F438E|nr:MULTISPECIES: DUF1684 domain-containing protein [unclassified Corallococcus]MBN9682169.1 DUF1684 domain-containing protein [Corallococcus sp. NCSPR001]WAS86269.1 DUF1684 domain-containing protein [Corallococcus sp. NCRR]